LEFALSADAKVSLTTSLWRVLMARYEVGREVKLKTGQIVRVNAVIVDNGASGNSLYGVVGVFSEQKIADGGKPLPQGAYVHDADIALSDLEPFISRARSYLNLLSTHPNYARRFLGILSFTAPVEAGEIRRLFPEAEVSLLLPPVPAPMVVPPAYMAARNWANESRLPSVEELLRARLPKRSIPNNTLRNALRGSWSKFTNKKHDEPKGYYMDVEARKKSVLTLDNGRLYNKDKTALTGRVQYVLSLDGTLYGQYYPLWHVEKRQQQEFHTRYLAGNPVRVGGWLHVKQSCITQIGNDSGHYKPRPEQLLYLLDHLHEHKVPLKNVQLYIEPTKKTYSSAEDFRVHRKLTSCPLKPVPVKPQWR
jgi:hypothetical protein